MASFAVAGRASIAGTNLLPLVSIYGATTVTPRVREIGLFNTTAVACCAGVVRLSSAGTVGAALVEMGLDDPTHTALVTGFAGHSSTGPTITAGVIRQASIGAAIGAGVIWTFPDQGLLIPASATAAIAVIIPTGTGQVLDYYIQWDE